MKYWIWTLLFYAHLLQAAEIAPIDGLWWNPQEPGRGIFIETQDNITVAAFYHYDNSGNNQWWLVAGELRTNQNGNLQLDGRWLQYHSGQCPGCNWRQAGSNDAGAVSIEFETDITATLYWQGGATPLQRQYWAFETQIDMLTGAWNVILTAENSIPLASQLWLNQPDGNVLTGSDEQNGFVYAEYFPDSNQLVMIDDRPTSFSIYYDVYMRANKFYAWYWIETDGTVPQGNPDGLATGYRWASKSRVTTGIGPFNKNQRSQQLQLQQLQQRYEQAGARITTPVTLPPPNPVIFSKLQQKR